MELGYLKCLSLPRFNNSVPYVTFLGNPNFKLEIGLSVISVSALARRGIAERLYVYQNALQILNFVVSRQRNEVL